MSHDPAAEDFPLRDFRLARTRSASLHPSSPCRLSKAPLVAEINHHGIGRQGLTHFKTLKNCESEEIPERRENDSESTRRQRCGDSGCAFKDFASTRVFRPRRLSPAPLQIEIRDHVIDDLLDAGVD